MSKIINNPITSGNHGSFGKLISFRKYAGQELMVSKPGKRTVAPSKKQSSNQERFNSAVRYGNRIAANPQSKEVYMAAATRKLSFFVLAVRDFLKAPVVEQIDVSQYSGNAGDKIKMIAYDDFKITKAFIQILDHQGALVEEGWALAPVSNHEWEYTATSTQAATNGYFIVATAYDLPGNQGVMEMELPA